MVPEVIRDKGIALGLTESRVNVNVFEGTDGGGVGGKAASTGVGLLADGVGDPCLGTWWKASFDA